MNIYEYIDINFDKIIDDFVAIKASK